jgi:hypothetical protein
MNTTKAIIILVVFITGLILGYNYFVVNAPLSEEVISEESMENQNQGENPNDFGLPTDIPYYNPAGGTMEAGRTPDQLCTSFGGQWSAEFSECLGISGEVCMEIGGNWNECASACRNDANAEMCTMQCVQVCDFKGIPLEVM